MVCLSVSTFSATTRNGTTKERYQKVQRYTGLILKLANFVKVLRSRLRLDSRSYNYINCKSLF